MGLRRLTATVYGLSHIAQVSSLKTCEETLTAHLFEALLRFVEHGITVEAPNSSEFLDRMTTGRFFQNSGSSAS